MEMEDKIVRTLDAMEHPENFTKEELDVLLGDKECVRICRDILDSREALARRYATAPDIEAEWQFFQRAARVMPGIYTTEKKEAYALYQHCPVGCSLSYLVFIVAPVNSSRIYRI